MKSNSNPPSQWLLQRLECLKGKTIVDVFIDEDHTGCPVLLFDDETLATVQSDPEGNGPGFLRIIPVEKRT